MGGQNRIRKRIFSLKTVIVSTFHKDESSSHLFGVFESKEKYLEEIKPHLDKRGKKGPFNWANIEIGAATLTAEEIEINQFQDYI